MGQWGPVSRLSATSILGRRKRTCGGSRRKVVCVSRSENPDSATIELGTRKKVGQANPRRKCSRRGGHRPGEGDIVVRERVFDKIWTPVCILPVLRLQPTMSPSSKA